MSCALTAVETASSHAACSATSLVVAGRSHARLRGRRGRRARTRRPPGAAEGGCRLPGSWSPNGRWIATWYEGGAGGHARPVRLVDPAGRMGPRVGAGRLAAWAPDGRRLAYEAPDGLRVLDLRARRTMLLTRETAYTAADYDERPLGLSWSRDGRSMRTSPEPSTRTTASRAATCGL